MNEQELIDFMLADYVADPCCTMPVLVVEREPLVPGIIGYCANDDCQATYECELHEYDQGECQICGHLCEHREPVEEVMDFTDSTGGEAWSAAVCGECGMNWKTITEEYNDNYPSYPN